MILITIAQTVQVGHLQEWLKKVAPEMFTLVYLQRIGANRDVLMAYILLLTGLRPQDRLPSCLTEIQSTLHFLNHFSTLIYDLMFNSFPTQVHPIFNSGATHIQLTSHSNTCISINLFNAICLYMLNSAVRLTDVCKGMILQSAWKQSNWNISDWGAL